MNLKTIKKLAIASATFLAIAPATFAADVQDFLKAFDFETGRVLIVAPEGVAPSADWSIQFKADIGSRQAASPSIAIDYTPVAFAKDGLPSEMNATELENAFVLNVTPRLSNSAAQTRTDFVSLSQMDESNELNIRMSLGAAFRIEEGQQTQVCSARKTPTPVEMWVKTSDGAEWQRMSDFDNLWRFGMFLRSAINSACPTV